MHLADQWQHMLDTGEVRNRAELARRAGVSGMWVTNVLALLKLHPGIQAWVRGLPLGTPERFVTERALREIGGAEAPPDVGAHGGDASVVMPAPDLVRYAAQVRLLRAPLLGSPTDHRHGLGNKNVEDQRQVAISLQLGEKRFGARVVDIRLVEKAHDDVGVEDNLSHRRVPVCLRRRHRRSSRARAPHREAPRSSLDRLGAHG